MIKARIEGGPEIARTLTSLPKVFTTRKVRAAMRTAGEPMRETAARLAPRSDEAPHMADNIRWQAHRAKGGDIAVRMGPTRDFFYGMFQEFGTAHHSAQPFMRPAADQHAAQVIEDIGAEFWALIKKQL